MKKFTLSLATLPLLLALNGWSAAPANDRFANRITLTGTNVTVTGSNIGANKEGGEPQHAANAGGNSVWWTWTAPRDGDTRITTDGSLTLDTNSLDTLLGVYVGSTLSTLTVVATNDDHGVVVTGRVRFAARASTVYQIAVDGYNDGSGAASGNIKLTLVFIPEPILRPPNDNFASRIVLNGASVTNNGSNVGASREADEPLHTDQLRNMGDTSLWWRWTAPSASNVVITTVGSDFDTLLGIYTGSILSNLTLVAQNDDVDPANRVLTSAVSLSPTVGQTYWIAVDGFDGASGRVVLQIASPSIWFGKPMLLSDSTCRLTLNGVGVGTYDIQASEDLRAWASIGSLLKTNGSATFIDPAASNIKQRFYRASPKPDQPGQL